LDLTSSGVYSSSSGETGAEEKKESQGSERKEGERKTMKLRTFGGCKIMLKCETEVSSVVNRL